LAGCYVVVGGSSNAYLAALVPSQGTLSPAFSATTYTYSITLSNAAGGMQLTPTVQDSYATVAVNGTSVPSGTASTYLPLNVGTTSFTILVTAENGNTLQYTVNVTTSYLLDTFDRANTSGPRDVGLDWTVYGSGSDSMYINSDIVSSSWLDTGNSYGVSAAYGGSVDYTKRVYASALIYVPSTAFNQHPSFVGGIRIDSSQSSWSSGYYAELQSDGTNYMLYAGNFANKTFDNYQLATTITGNTWYLLELTSTGGTLTATLYDSTGTTAINSVQSVDATRAYSTGKVVFYNYLKKGSSPLGGSLYFDNFEIGYY